MLPWALLSFNTAVTEATKDVLLKQSLRTIAPLPATAVQSLMIAACLVPLVGFTGIPALDTTFWLALLSSSLFNALAFWLYSEALHHGDLSLVAPLISLSPVFMLVTSPLVVGEYANAQAGAGVILVAIGAYVLNSRGVATKPKHWYDPLRTIWRSRGSRSMFLVAILWSITSNIDKVGIQHSSPFFWLLWVYASIGLLLLPRSLQLGIPEAAPWRRLWLSAVIATFGISSQMYALLQTQVVNVIAIKRLSTLIGVLYGAWIFREQHLRDRLLGAGLMLAGAVLILI